MDTTVPHRLPNSSVQNPTRKPMCSPETATRWLRPQCGTRVWSVSLRFLLPPTSSPVSSPASRSGRARCTAISAEPCDPLRRQAQAVPFRVQDLELHRVVLLVGRIRARDIAALGRLIRRTVKAAERVRHIKRDRGTHPVSCQQWRFGSRQVAPQAKPPASAVSAESSTRWSVSYTSASRKAVAVISCVSPAKARMGATRKSRNTAKPVSARAAAASTANTFSRHLRRRRNTAASTRRSAIGAMICSCTGSSRQTAAYSAAAIGGTR